VEFKVQIAGILENPFPEIATFKGLNGVAEYHVGDIYKYAVAAALLFRRSLHTANR